MRRRSPGILVIHRRDIASTPRILVLIPSAPDRGILVVADQVQVEAAFIDIMGKVDGAGTAPDDNNSDLPRDAAGLFDDRVVPCGHSLADTERPHVAVL